MSRKIGILGGTFDPVHIGHLVLASCAREQLQTDSFLLVPNNKSPLKAQDPIAPFIDRLEMLKLALGDAEGYTASDLEGRRGGISYTIDTLRALKSGYHDAELFLVLGRDALSDITMWKEHEDVLRLARLAAVDRGVGGAWPATFNYEKVSMPSVDISSTLIRERLRDSLPIDFFVPAAVAEYIRSRNLYSVS